LKSRATLGHNCTAGQALLLWFRRFSGRCTANFCTGCPGAVSAPMQVACTTCCCTSPNAPPLIGQHHSCWQELRCAPSLLP
jgi:hypothetical protein